MPKSSRESLASEQPLPSTKGDDTVLRDVKSFADDSELAVERRIMRKVDRRLIPMLALLHSISLIDMSNLAFARVAGMGDDLKLDIGNRYSIVSLLFFVPYILLQLPSNIFLRYFNPITLLSMYVVFWGSVEVGMAFLPSWGYLAFCRILLGALEAGFFPGIVFIITTWYKRHEVQKRLALLVLISIIIAGLANFLGYAISLLKGKGGLNAWQWIFLVCGLLTIVLGVIAYFLIPSFPDQNKFLTPEQTAFVLDRIERDRGDSIPDKITKEKVLKHLRDWTIWANAIMFMCASMPSYMASYFLTIMLVGMGWSVEAAMILSAPPVVFAACLAFFFAYVSDRMKMRATFLAIEGVLIIMGLSLAGYAEQRGVRYAGLFLVLGGATSCIPGVIAYNANNIVSHSKRSVSTGLIASFGGIGGILVTTVFRQQDYPRYFNGIWVTIGCQFLMLGLLCSLSVTYWRRNNLARAGQLVPEGQPGFLYTL